MSMGDDILLDEAIFFGLKDIVGEDMFQDFVQRFLVDCKDRVGRIESHHANGDFKGIELEAHTLGTTAATYGAYSLEKLCRLIEYLPEDKRTDLPVLIEKLQLLSKRVIAKACEVSGVAG